MANNDFYYIGGFDDIVDAWRFYMWYLVPCVRLWMKRSLDFFVILILQKTLKGSGGLVWLSPRGRLALKAWNFMIIYLLNQSVANMPAKNSYLRANGKASKWLVRIFRVDVLARRESWCLFNWMEFISTFFNPMPISKICNCPIVTASEETDAVHLLLKQN